MDRSNRSYVDTIYVEKDRKKGKKERRKTWKHPYMRTG
jgi:hypothetical protein